MSISPVDDVPAAGVARPVVDGVFFRRPVALPKGRHGLSRESVVDSQRERVMIALTELLAATGYAEVRVGDIATRAAVSRAAFYQCFPDKQACALAAYDRFITVLLRNLGDALAPEQSIIAFADSAVRAYLGPIQSDPVVGRAFQVEIDTMGSPARQRRRDSLGLIADALAQHHRRTVAASGAGVLLPRSAYLGLVYAVRQLACDALEPEDSPDLLSQVPELTGWLLPILTS